MVNAGIRGTVTTKVAHNGHGHFLVKKSVESQSLVEWRTDVHCSVHVVRLTVDQSSSSICYHEPPFKLDPLKALVNGLYLVPGGDLRSHGWAVGNLSRFFATTWANLPPLRYLLGSLAACWIPLHDSTWSSSKKMERVRTEEEQALEGWPWASKCLSVNGTYYIFRNGITVA